jgi:hypothetical protein
MEEDKRYVKLERIGKGSYGQVFKVYLKIIIGKSGQNHRANTSRQDNQSRG